jgi:site-specific recombinase XerD
MNQLAIIHQSPLLDGVTDKDGRSRIGKFDAWLQTNGLSWHNPDMRAYRDSLLQTLAPATVAAHLSSIRGRYHALIDDNRVRDSLYTLAPADAAPSDKKAVVDEILQRLANAVKPSAAPVKQITKQDRADSEHLRLTRQQASTLMAAPGVTTLTGLRDTALIAAILCTGVRETEACALDVADLRQRLGGELALHVRKGKGAKERLVPYGELAFCLPIVDAWLQAAGIESGPVFRGFYKGSKRIRATRLTARAVQTIVGSYPMVIDGHSRKVQPHDLRRTYARRLYEAGVDMEAIRQNLGHSDRKTTQGYIGTLGAELRKPPAVYDFDLGGLQEASLLATDDVTTP